MKCMKSGQAVYRHILYWLRYLQDACFLRKAMAAVGGLPPTCLLLWCLCSA